MRWVAYGLALLVVATMGVLAATLPPDWRVQDRVMLFGLGLVIAAILHLLGRPRLVATERNVTVVNSIRTHVLAWPEIVDAQMREGEPWPSVDLSDGSTLAVMGIQSADGDLARRNLADFRTLLHQRGETPEPERG
jgi:hypothetical protein